MSTALDIIKGALRRINSYQPGEALAPWDAQDALDALNDLLDSWSTDKLHVFATNESILQWVVGQNQYTVGNPTNTSLGEPAFTGQLRAASNSVGSVTNVPADLKVGATITDSAGVLPAGTTLTGIAGSSLTLSANALSTPASSPVQFNYTVPGDFAIPRPLRITGGFTRVNQLDFWLDVYATQEQYTSVLYKAQPGPWPVMAWYNPLMPCGVLNVYQTPGQGAELHLFSDVLLSNLTLNETFNLPQGYARALKWCLAKELCAEYGFALTDSVKVNAGESLAAIKALNAQPAKVSTYDRELVRGNRPDGGWIMHGGFK